MLLLMEAVRGEPRFEKAQGDGSGHRRHEHLRGRLVVRSPQSPPQAPQGDAGAGSDARLSMSRVGNRPQRGRNGPCSTGARPGIGSSSDSHRPKAQESGYRQRRHSLFHGRDNGAGVIRGDLEFYEPVRQTVGLCDQHAYCDVYKAGLSIHGVGRDAPGGRYWQKNHPALHQETAVTLPGKFRSHTWRTIWRLRHWPP